MERAGFFIPVTRVEGTFRRSSSYDDPIAIFTRMERLSSRGCTFAYEIRSPDGSLLADGSTHHVFTDVEGRACRGSDEILGALERFRLMESESEPDGLTGWPQPDDAEACWEQEEDSHDRSPVARRRPRREGRRLSPLPREDRHSRLEGHARKPRRLRPDRREGKVVHFVFLSLWESREAIRAFAGDDLEKARYYPEDEHFLLELEPTVTHYEVAASP